MAREEWKKTEGETDLGLECGWDPRRGKQRCMSFGSKISSGEDSQTLTRGQLCVFCPNIQVTHSPGDTAPGGSMSRPAANSSQF